MFRFVLQMAFIRRVLQLRFVRIALVLSFLVAVIAGIMYAVAVFNVVQQRSYTDHVHPRNSR